MLLQILWELVKSRDLDSMLALVPDEVVDALQQRKGTKNSFSAADAALLRKLPNFQLDSYAERHILFRAPSEVAPLSVLQVSPSKCVFRYAVSSPSGEQCVLSVVMSLQEGLTPQYGSSPIVVPAWRLASITGESASTDEPVTSPAPCLSPEAAVQAQLQALKSDDLATVFAFASPGNQAVTGPLRRFTAMLASPTYRPLVGYSSSEQQHAYMRSADSYTTVVAIKSSNTGLGRAVQLMYGWELSLCEDMTWRTNSVQLLSGSTLKGGVSFSLPHPRTGRPQGLLLTNGVLMEIQRFKQKHSSWFVGTRVITDGGVYLCTPVDVLLVLLPVLERNRGKATAESPAMFRCLEELLAMDNCPCLESIIQAAQPHLSCVCDVKEAGGDMYYRLNDRRVLAWLTCKVTHLTCVLHAQLAGMDASHRQAYVLGFLSEYVSPALIAQLTAHLCLGMPAAPEPTLQPHQLNSVEKRPVKVVDPKEIARKRAAETKEATMRKFAAGTKKISSFFTKK
ncbi:MAG: hypothetical protein WDW38_001351 [Sanguina aurantia]